MSWGGPLAHPSGQPCRALPPRLGWVMRTGVPPLHYEAHQGSVWEVHTHTQTHRRTRTHKAPCNLCSHSADLQPASLSLRMHSAELARPLWAQGWGFSEIGLCPSLRLFQASLPLFSPSHPPPSHPPPTPLLPPLLPRPPPTQRHRSCYWGSLERGAIPSPKRLAKTSGAQQQAPIAGPKRSF